MLGNHAGVFNWNSHANMQDFFMILKGKLTIELEAHTVTLKASEIFIVPQVRRHRPVAQNEAHLLLVEPSGTPDTGDETSAAPRQSA